MGGVISYSVVSSLCVDIFVYDGDESKCNERYRGRCLVFKLRLSRCVGIEARAKALPLKQGQNFVPDSCCLVICNKNLGLKGLKGPVIAHL